MNRIFVIVALTVLFHLFSFPVQVQAQVSEQYAEQREINATGKNVVSLTTTDLLNSQDLIPPVTAAPAQRERVVNSAKKAKSAATTGAVRESEDVVKKSSTLLASGGVDIVTDEMIPAERPRRSLEREALVLSGGVTHRVATGNNRLDELIAAAAARNGIDQHLILAVMKQESSFNPQAISYKGARGLMQLMPATAARFGVRDIFDPAQNIEGGARYLRFLLDTFKGDLELTLAGYNAGENAVARYGNQIPPYRETQDYVRKISAHYARLKNGSLVRRPTNQPLPANKKTEPEIITSGQTMTQY